MSSAYINPKEFYLEKKFDIALHWTWERNIEKDQQQEKPQYNIVYIVEYATHCTIFD